MADGEFDTRQSRLRHGQRNLKLKLNCDIGDRRYPAWGNRRHRRYSMAQGKGVHLIMRKVHTQTLRVLYSRSDRQRTYKYRNRNEIIFIVLRFRLRNITPSNQTRGRSTLISIMPTTLIMHCAYAEPSTPAPTRPSQVDIEIGIEIDGIVSQLSLVSPYKSSSTIPRTHSSVSTIIQAHPQYDTERIPYRAYSRSFSYSSCCCRTKRSYFLVARSVPKSAVVNNHTVSEPHS